MKRIHCLYVIIDGGLISPTKYLKVAQEAIRGGAKIIQLRDKKSLTKELIDSAISLKRLCSKGGILFIVNDRVDITKACSVDGVHLGQDDMPIKFARKLLGKKKIIGISCHNLREAKTAEREGADYISLGPIFETKTKVDKSMPCGVKLIRRIKKKVRIPVVAIGGIDEKNIIDVIDAGADAVAVARAVIKRKNIKSACQNLSRLFNINR